jgi:chemotaxis protein MotB
MPSQRRLEWMLVGLWLAACCGCQFVPASQMNTVQAQNRALSEQNHAQLAELDNLKSHNRQIEDKLIKAEEQLALADEKRGADSKRLANYRRERDQLRDQFSGYSPGRVQIPAGLSQQLVDLARKHPSLQFDPQTGVAKLDTDVVFDSGNAELKPQAEQVLADLATVLQSDAAREMRIMIVGHTDAQKIAGKETRQRYGDNWNLSTARALAVAGYLHNAGVAEPRMGVAGYGGQQPIASNSNPADRRRNRRVELFVIPPDYPIVGWTETSPSLY